MATYTLVDMHALNVQAIELERAALVNVKHADTIAESGTIDAAARAEVYYMHAIDLAIRAGSYRAAILRGAEHGRAWSRASA